MSKVNELRIHLDNHQRRRVALGKHNFLGKVYSAFHSAGWRTEFRADSDAELLATATSDAYSLVHMAPPISKKGLTFRLAYVFPFWKIEATGTRWEYDSARATFDPDRVDLDLASEFTERARRRLYPWLSNAPETGAIITVPLQGRLLETRAHQTHSPIEMVRETLRRFPGEDVRIMRHPKENYSAEERRALADLVADNPKARVGEWSIEYLLPKTRLVVTQNSSVAFSALFARRPVVLFAKSDFHHIGADVRSLGVDGAFDAALGQPPEFDAYLYWFLQMNCINAGRDDVIEQILRRVRTLGWPV